MMNTTTPPDHPPTPPIEMPMPPNKILVVEDEDPQRELLVDALRDRGFEVEGASDAAEARKLFQEMGEDLGLAILDMDLKEPNDVTGAHLGIEMKQAFKDPPEFLINSAHDRLVYYKLALKLGAAAYLHKVRTVPDTEDVIRHARALLLRRMVGRERPEDSQRIRRIAETSRSRVEAVAQFCRELLAPALRETLGTPYLLLLSDSARTRCYGGEGCDLPDGRHPDYSTLAALVFCEADTSKPFELKEQRSTRDEIFKDPRVGERLDGAAFVPLIETRDFRLTLGILQSDRKGGEDAVALAETLMRFFRTTLLTQLTGLIALWTEVNERRKTVLAETSRFCLYVGQEQVALFDQAREKRTLNLEDPVLQAIEEQAQDLYSAGSLLAALRGREGAPAPAEAPQIDVAELIDDVWQKLAGQSELPPKLLRVHGHCFVRGDEDDIYFAVSRLLHWLADRVAETPKSLTPGIQVHCMEAPDGPEIVFEDHSRRLSCDLREELFVPFGHAARQLHLNERLRRPGLHLPLYLAKMLVELRNGGNLEDRSEELAGDVGHRLIMRFPNIDQMAA